MTVSHAKPVWAAPVSRYLKENLPRDDARDGWNDGAMTAYQLGCDLLVALGDAKRTPWGASDCDAAEVSVWPRWDDAATITLWLMKQLNQVVFRSSEGSAAASRTMRGFVVRPAKPLSPKPGNIAASTGFGEAWATDTCLELLGVMGLVSRGHWTDEAKVVLWRTSPKEWALDLAQAAEFKTALSDCVGSCPSDVNEEIGGAVSLDASDIARELDAFEGRFDQMKRPLPPHQDLLDRVRSSLIFRAENKLDWLFFEGWRIKDGWLAREEAIPVFHDRLAIEMRRALVLAMFPGSDMGLALQHRNGRVA